MNTEYWVVPIQREADPIHHSGVYKDNIVYVKRKYPYKAESDP